tara:strand:- start:8335 stop:9666 length:1332 start_codon:yes stop_codon:yes gene_type:complete
MTNQTEAPHNEEAEEKIIATCMNYEDGSFYDDVSHVVAPDDFYTARGKLLFGAVKAICDRNEPLNLVTTLEQLKSVNGTDIVGGVIGLMSVMEKITTPLDFKFCAKTVAEKARLRNVIRSCRLAREKAEMEGTPSQEIRAELESDLNSDIRIDTNDLDLTSATECINTELDDILSGKFVPDVVRTNVGRLDMMLGSGGIAAGEVMVIAAPTSCGKSALALNIALSAAKRQGKGVAIFSLEMPKKQITKRMGQTLSGINYNTVNLSKEGAARAEKLKATNKELEELPIYTSHVVRGTDDLAGQARNMVKKLGVKLLVIDYLQLIPFESKRMGKAEGIANISHRIKQIALELNVAVLLLAQVNREGAKREGGLSLYDLKDSGDIENDADVVLLMYPSNQGDPELSKKVDGKGAYTELMYKIAKNREGERDIGCMFRFYHCIGRFA